MSPFLLLQTSHMLKTLETNCHKKELEDLLKGSYDMVFSTLTKKKQLELLNHLS